MKYVPCSVDGCMNNAFWRARGARGMCHAHYRRVRRHGSIEKQKRSSKSLEWLKNQLNTKEISCIIWPFGKNKQGYGLLGAKGFPKLAHAAICQLAHGERPANMDAAHSCGNPSCVNPNHLRWATRSENMNDKLAHGTDFRGEKSPVSKLTKEQVLYIRSNPKESQFELAKMWGVDQSTISKAKTKGSWSWL